MLTGVATPTVVTLLIVIFSMVPPRVLALLNRIPAGTALSTISPLTSTSRMPPEVSLPMVTPAAPRVVVNPDSLRRPVDAQTVGVAARLEADCIVVAIDVAMRHQHVRRGIDIHPIGTRPATIRVIADDQAVHRDTLRVADVHRPKARPFERQPLEIDIGRFVDLDEPRPLAIVVHRPAQSLGLVFPAPHLPILVPPDLAVAIDRPLAADLD